MTKGMKTSEFGATAVVALLALFNERLGLGLTPDTLQVLAIAIAGYAVSRGVAKRGETK